MYYKIEKETPLYESLIQLQNKMKKCRIAINKICEEFGATQYCMESRKLFGGISALQFDQQPDNWKKVGKPYNRLYYPKAKNKKDLETLAELETIEYSELNKLVGFSGPQTPGTPGGMFWIDTVNLFWGVDDIALIEVRNECKYTPVEGMVEILNSEWVVLNNTKEAKKA